MRRAAGAVALCALAAGVLAAPVAAAPKAPLDHDGRWLTDAKGRVVILHGFNMVNKVGSYRPADTGFGADDARFLRRHGFNTIRLGIIYKGLEPEPPDRTGSPTTGRAT
jgi:endoglycosylceramidase